MSTADEINLKQEAMSKAIQEALQKVLGDGFEIHVGNMQVEEPNDEDRRQNALKSLEAALSVSRRRTSLLEQLQESVATPIKERRENQIVEELVLMNQLENLDD